MNWHFGWVLMTKTPLLRQNLTACVGSERSAGDFRKRRAGASVPHWQRAVWPQINYGLASGAITLLDINLLRSQRDRTNKRLFLLGVVFYLLAFSLWLLDNHTCGSLRWGPAHQFSAVKNIPAKYSLFKHRSHRSQHHNIVLSEMNW